MSAPEPILRGKVREMYAADEGYLVMVASDRISAYDVIMPTLVPDKGRVLTAMSLSWFDRMADLVPNHLAGTTLADLPEPLRSPENVGRAVRVRALEMFPVECVARGYLSGSGWRDYQATGRVSGHALPAGLRMSDRLPEPIFTPASKATSGHDENITRDEAGEAIGTGVLAELERLTLAIYRRAADDCRAAGIILADTKFEFGRAANGEIVLADEVLTPDSSRFWPAESWVPGESPPSFDKQYVRDWLDASGWDHSPPAPALPDDVVAGTRQRYVDAYERLTGRRFDTYLKEAA
jgi:phosphoribosylaminoimidazole-succinocarboxamide synthase